jgi:hypothetical protein
MIDANASSIENALMAFAIGAVLLGPSLWLLYRAKAFMRRRRRRPAPVLSFFDVIRRR